MSAADTSGVAASDKRLSFAELAAITAAVFALNALAIDMMLPALGLIGDDLNIATDNDRQLIVGIYLFANGLGQLPFGPIVDRFGRRPVLLICLAAYMLGNVMSVLAPSFGVLLAARAFQGLATAGARVAIVAIVRDHFAGRRMAKVLSLAMTIFMAAPILAPAIGQGVLALASWRWIFWALFAYGGGILIWSFIRAPASLNPEDRQPLDVNTIASAYWTFLKDRCAMGYTLASACCFGALFGFISAAEQLFLELYEVGSAFALAFASISLALAASSLLNARFVERYGMRRITHAAVIGFVIITVAHYGFAVIFGDSLWRFITFTGMTFFAIGLIGPNSSALALERMGHIAGYASAANGFVSTTLSAVLGVIVGRQFDGTALPIIAGFAVLGVVSLLIIYWTEGGRLFQAGLAEASSSEEADETAPTTPDARPARANAE